MANEIPTFEDLYEAYKDEVQSRAPGLTDFEEGSNLDAMAGGTGVMAQELVKFIIDRFARTFIDTANGPEVTGGPDDLQNLLVDHFGDSFSRPGASQATVTLLFSRPNTDEGNVEILAGTVVKTDKDANGNEIRFATEIDVTMTGLSTEVSARAVDGGSDSNVSPNTLINIEDSLTDPSVTVTNALAATGGAPIDTDSEYREFARNQFDIIRGATGAAIQAAAENVPGVEIATLIESIIKVIEYDIGTDDIKVGAEPFDLPRGILYIADANGTASAALISDVEAAILTVRACGVVKQVLGATPISVDWIASYTLDPGGPNFAELNSDPSQVVASMEQYIRDLPIGTGFSRALAKQAILAIWGSGGTGDLTDFVINQPTGDIAADPEEKLIPGTVEIV